MHNTSPLIPLMLAAAFCVNPAAAQTGTAEQKAARAEIEQLTKRIEQLSKQLGPDSDVRITIVERTVDGDSKTVDRRVISNSPDGRQMAWSQADSAERGGPPRIGLGVVMAANPDAGGVKVAAVSPGGPAKAAGLQAGDIITAINGKTLTAKNQDGLAQARAQLAGLKDGQAVKIGYTRAGKPASTTVKAAKIEPRMVINRETRRGAPGDAPPAMIHATRWHGLNMASLNPQLGAYFGTTSGVLVLAPSTSLPVLQGGDIIRKVDGKSVNTPREVLNALRPAKTGEKVPVEILRNRKAQSVSLTVPKERAFNIPAPPAPPVPPAAPGVPQPPAPPAPPRTALFIEEDGASYAFIGEAPDMPDGIDSGETEREIEIIEWRTSEQP